MVSLLDRPDRSGLIATLIFGLGWQATAVRAPSFVPPPVVIGLVWVVLFAFMALARWELNRAVSTRSDKAGLIVLFVLCAAYPLYTAGPRSDLVGEGGNVALLVLTGWLAASYVRRVPRATTCLMPLFLWLSFASVAGAFTVAHAN